MIHKDNIVWDSATYKQLAGAAERVYGTCVARGDQRPQGGWIRDLGKRYFINVIPSISYDAVAAPPLRILSHSTSTGEGSLYLSFTVSADSFVLWLWSFVL